MAVFTNTSTKLYIDKYGTYARRQSTNPYNTTTIYLNKKFQTMNATVLLET